MEEKTPAGEPNPLPAESDVETDPDAGQVMGSDGEAPEDPAARSLYQGCLIVLLFIGIILGIFSLLYRFLVA